MSGVVTRLSRLIGSCRRAQQTSVVIYLLGAIALIAVLSPWWINVVSFLLWTAICLNVFILSSGPRIQAILALPWFIWGYTPTRVPFIEALGQIGTPQAVEPLIQALRDPVYLVR